MEEFKASRAAIHRYGVLAFWFYEPMLKAVKEGSMNQTRISAIGGLVAFFVAFLWLLPSVGVADTEEVECPDDTIQEAVDDAEPGDTILVSGTCNENVVIPEEIHRVTLDGGGGPLGVPAGATVNGGPLTTTGLNAIQVRGTGITIKGFTITGGQDGVQVARGGTAVIDANNIQGTGRHGVRLNQGHARIRNNIIQDNPGTGIFISNRSDATIGTSGPRDARVAEPNTVQNNEGVGIRVNDSSIARIGFNTIINNNRGIFVARSSFARIGGESRTEASGNTITGNDREGIRVSSSSSATIQGNTISNNVNRQGVLIDKNSYALISPDDGSEPPTPNTIQGNGREGIGVNSSSADISGNTITGNDGDGIIVDRSSFARIFSDTGPDPINTITPNTISNNGRNGIVVAGVSRAEITDNTIDQNDRDGIIVDENSGLDLEDNTGSNGDVSGFFGLRCGTGSFATGTIDALTGTSGAANFTDGTCIENLDDFPPVP